MNIVMMTNTYKPILGGLEKSVEAFTKGYREKGHRVVIVAPNHEGAESETDVIRIPAIQHFNGTDFSIELPVPGILTEKLGDFKPDIVHSHHPFLIGDTALRLAHKYNAPLVFTHHSLYEKNTHYVAKNSRLLKRFVIQLSTGYANLADRVFAPSESLKELMKHRGVEAPVDIVPTGIELERFTGGNPREIREQFKLPPRAFVVGHVGRLAPEKNLEFLARAVAAFLKKRRGAHFLLVGKGPSEPVLQNFFRRAGLLDRLHRTGPLDGQDLVAAYRAMDVFAFASRSETQGLVLTEAMACGVPVVAVDAIGVREVVKDNVNGRLLASERLEDFVSALEDIADRSEKKIQIMKQKCLKTTEGFSIQKSVDRALGIYMTLALKKEFTRKPSEDSPWEQTLRLIRAHWNLTKNLTKATTEALLKT